ncbi:MAG: DUF4352 domain-containing protein [Halobacteriota archaeon]
MRSKIALVAVLLLVVASLSVGGCTTQNTTTQSTQDTNALNITYKAVSVPQKHGSGNYAGERPAAGNKYVGYNATVKNVNAKDRSVAFNFFELRDTQGGVYQHDGMTGMAGINKFGNYRTEPGDVVNGTLVFEVPQNATFKSLTYDDGATKIVTTL